MVCEIEGDVDLELEPSDPVRVGEGGDATPVGVDEGEVLRADEEEEAVDGALGWPDTSEELVDGALKWPDTSAMNTFARELEDGVARDVEDLEGAEGGARGAGVLGDADALLLPVLWEVCAALVGGLGLGDVEVASSRASSSSKKFFETNEWSVAC